MHATTTSTTTSRRGKRLLIVLGGLVVALVILVALAPTIASAIAPGIIESQAGKQLNGSVKVGGLSLSWGGPQKIGPVTVRDAAGKDVAVVNVDASVGLLGLAGGLGDLGTVTLSGKASLARNADGTTTIDTLLKKPAAGASSGAPSGGAPSGGGAAPTLPAALKVKVVVDKFDLDVADAQLAQRTGGQVETISLKDVRATANLAPAGKSDVELKLAASTGGKGGNAGGTLAITGTIANLADASGKLTTDKASVDAKVSASDLPVAVIDALAGLGGRLSGVVGPTLAAQIDVKGGMAGGDATINVSGQNLKIAGVAKLADGVVSTPSPITIEASGKGLAALGGDLQKALADDKGQPPLTISEFPDVTVALSDVRVKLPKDGGKLDLRGSSASAVVRTTRITGSVLLDEGQGKQALEVKPLELKLAAPDLGGPVRLAGQTSALIGGQAAGVVDIDVTATGLLNADGSPVTGMPGGLSGKVALTGLRTALAQPFVASTGLELQRDIGPTLDVNLTANTTGTAAAGELPPTSLQFALGSAKLSGGGAAVLSSSGVRAQGDGVWLKLAGAGALASKLAPKDAGVLITPSASGGDLSLKLTGLSVPLTKERKPVLDKVEAKVDVNVGGIALRLTDPKTPGWASMPLDIASIAVVSQLRGGGSPRVDVNGAFSYDKQPFTLAGGMDLVGIFSPDGMIVRPEKTRPVGSLELKNVPSNIAGFVAKPPNTLDLGGLVREIVGNSVTVTLTTQPSKKLEGGVDVALMARGDHLNADVAAALSDTALAVGGAQVEATMAPSTAEFLVRKFAPDLAKGAQPPRLMGPARLVASVDPLTIPMENMSPKLDKVGEAGVRVSLDGQTVIDGLAIPESRTANGTITPAKNLGAVGVENFKLTAKAPVGALMGGGSAPVKADLSAALLAGAGKGAVDRLAMFTGSVDGSIAGGKPGKIDAGVKLDQIAVAAMDRFLAPALGQEGMMLAALGESGSVSLASKLDGTGKSTALEATLSANTQRLNMPKPTRLSMTDDRISLPDGAELTWTPDVKFLNGLLASPGGAPARDTVQKGVRQNAGQPATASSGAGVTVQSLGPVSVKLAKFSIAKPATAADGKPAVGPLKPGIFALALNANIPSAVVKLDDGKTFKVASLATEATSDSAGGLAFALNITGAELIDEKGVAQAPVPTSGVKGTIKNLGDAAGNVNINGAEITAAAQVPTFPTAIIDALANQNGLLVDALGPTVTLDARADKLMLDPAKGSGSLSASAKSAFAEASLQGNLDKGVFVSQAPLSVKVTQIQKSLSERLIKGIPITTSLEKTTAQLPAMVKGDSIRVPLNNDLSKLYGNFSVDPGELKFTTGGGFAKFLNVLSQKQEGYIGRKLQPLNVAVNAGVAKYQRWALPLGEFAIETEGTVDLVNRKLEVYTYVPFGALSDEAAGIYKKSLGNVPVLNELIQAATLMPFKTTGSFDNPKTEPDLERFVQEFGKRIRPDDLLKKGLEDGLGNLFKGKNKGTGVK